MENAFSIPLLVREINGAPISKPDPERINDAIGLKFATGFEASQKRGEVAVWGTTLRLAKCERWTQSEQRDAHCMDGPTHRSNNKWIA